MAELLGNKIDKLFEKFTSMEANTSSLHTEINDVKEKIKTNTEKINEKLRIHMELINKKLKNCWTKVERLEASIEFISEKFEEQKSKLTDIRKLSSYLKEENTLLNSTIKNVRLELETIKEKENENVQYIRSSFMHELSNIPVQGKNKNSLEIVCKVAELAKIDNFHRNQINVAHQISKNKMASIIVLFHKKSDGQNFYFQKKKISKFHVKWVWMEEDNAYEIVSDEPDAKCCIYVNESLAKHNHELLREARES